MLKNIDGTAYASETISEMIEQRFKESEFPYLSDILGSDWGANFPTVPCKVAAYKTAKLIYVDESGAFDVMLKWAIEDSKNA